MNKQKTFHFCHTYENKKNVKFTVIPIGNFRQAAGNRNCIISVDEIGYS